LSSVVATPFTTIVEPLRSYSTPLTKTLPNAVILPRARPPPLMPPCAAMANSVSAPMASAPPRSNR
jgi:hypothetical protein